MIDQGEFFDIPSPCKRICELNNRGYCKGCFRSRDERLYWNQFSNFQKQLVVNLCEKRRLKVLSAKQAALQPAVAEEPLPPQPDLFTALSEPDTAAELPASANPQTVITPAPVPAPASKPAQPGQIDLF